MPDEELDPEVLRRFLSDAFDPEQNAERQFVRWLEETIEYCDLLAQGASVPKEVRYLFWVRLYGVADDATDRLQKYEASHADSFTEYRHPNEDTLRSMVGDLLAILQQLRAALTTEEWTYVTFRRTFEAHPFQDKFRLTLNNGRLSGPKKVLGQDHTVEAMKAAIRRVRASFNNDDSAAAANFAVRVRPMLVAMKDGVQEYFEIQRP